MDALRDVLEASKTKHCMYVSSLFYAFVVIFSFQVNP